METVRTKYGEINGIKQFELYASGILKECTLEKNVQIETDFGLFTPKYDDALNRRKTKSSLEFFETGYIKKMYLQNQEIIKTKYGSFPTELVLFYRNGEIRKVFPLNGKITGFWTEMDEYKLSQEIELNINTLKINKKMMSIGFYENKSIKNITLWPKERMDISTIYGEINVRKGIAFYEDGSIKSIEPAKETKIQSPIGELTAFDSDMNGMNGDKNSLNFYKDGKVKSLISSNDKIKIYKNGEFVIEIAPEKIPNWCNESILVPVPMEIEFTDDAVIFDSKMKFEIKDYTFEICAKKDEIKACASCGS